jgi:hypothetical protein
MKTLSVREAEHSRGDVNPYALHYYNDAPVAAKNRFCSLTAAPCRSILAATKSLGDGEMVSLLTLDQLFGVRIPVSQLALIIRYFIITYV